MGNSFACCGKNDADPNNVDTNKLSDTKGGIKIRAIVKVQALIRGYLTRKKVKAIQQSMQIHPMMHNSDYNGPANYDNPDV